MDYLKFMATFLAAFGAIKFLEHLLDEYIRAGAPKKPTIGVGLVIMALSMAIIYLIYLAATYVTGREVFGW